MFLKPELGLRRHLPASYDPISCGYSRAGYGRPRQGGVSYDETLDSDPPARSSTLSRAACARAVTAYALPYSSTTSLPGGHIRAERYDRGIADVFAVEDEITEAIVAAIEPQLYARESFRPNASRRTAWMLGIW
jgi:hypothetical protein